MNNQWATRWRCGNGEAGASPKGLRAGNWESPQQSKLIRHLDKIPASQAPRVKELAKVGLPQQALGVNSSRGWRVREHSFTRCAVCGLEG